VKLEVVAEKIIRKDTISIQINYDKPQKMRKLMFGSKKNFDRDFGSDLLKVVLQVNYLGVSLIDEKPKPKELIFLKFEGLHLSNIWNVTNMSLIDSSVILADVQMDFQSNKVPNRVGLGQQVCLISQREISKSAFTPVGIWSNPQATPMMKIEMNYFTHANTQLVNIRARLSKLIINIDGVLFSRVFPLLTLIFNLTMQARNIFILDGEALDDTNEDLTKSLPKLQTKYNVSIRDLEADLFIEKVPELISTLSNDYVAKLMSMIFSDICFFPIKIKEFASDTVASPDPDQNRTQHQRHGHVRSALLLRALQAHGRPPVQHEAARKPHEDLLEPRGGLGQQLQREQDPRKRPLLQKDLQRVLHHAVPGALQSERQLRDELLPAPDEARRPQEVRRSHQKLGSRRE